MKETGTVVADYGQFYVYDAREGLRDPGRAAVADREALGRGLGVSRTFIAVYTSRQAGDVPVDVEVLAARPAPDVEGWDHVVEGSIEVASGTLVVGSWDDGGPAVRIGVPAGQVRLRVRARDLEMAEDERDSYSFQAWPEPLSPPALLKGWAGYRARTGGMP